MFFYLFFISITTLLFGSLPMLCVITFGFSCNLSCIIFLSKALIGSKVIDFLFFNAVFDTLTAKSCKAFILLFLYPSISNTIRYFSSIPLFPILLTNV